MSISEYVGQIEFKGDGFDVAAVSLLSSGYRELDDKLSGGWPSGVVTDILYDKADLNELRVLLPFLAQLSKRQARWLIWVAPPEIPDAQVLQMAGVDVSRVLVVRAGSISNRLASIERALGCGECSAVLAWPGSVCGNDLKRLQVAASKGGSYCYLMRDSSDARSEVSAAIRLQLTADEGGTGIELMKRAGGWPLPRFVVDTNIAGAWRYERQGSWQANIIAGPWSRGEHAVGG